MGRANDFLDGVKFLPILVGLAVLVVVGYYAVNVIAAVGVTLLILIVVGGLVWVFGGRLWDWLRHGKPIRRGGGDDGA